MTAFAIGSDDANLNIQAVADAMEDKGMYIVISDSRHVLGWQLSAFFCQSNNFHWCFFRKNIEKVYPQFVCDYDGKLYLFRIIVIDFFLACLSLKDTFNLNDLVCAKLYTYTYIIRINR